VRKANVLPRATRIGTFNKSEHTEKKLGTGGGDGFEGRRVRERRRHRPGQVRAPKDIKVF